MSYEVDVPKITENVLAINVAAAVHEGQRGVGFLSPENISRLIVPERILNAAHEVQEVIFLVSA
jgi:hypothetical protein